MRIYLTIYYEIYSVTYNPALPTIAFASAWIFEYIHGYRAKLSVYAYMQRVYVPGGQQIWYNLWIVAGYQTYQQVPPGKCGRTRSPSLIIYFK